MHAVSTPRVVVSGMGVNTRLGDDLGTYYDNLVAGRSGITNWTFFEHDGVYSKVGGDLSGYDAQKKVDGLQGRVPDDVHARLRKIFRTAPFSTRLSVLCAIDAWLDAGLGFDEEPWSRAVILGGHNLNEHYLLRNHATFQEEPDWIDPLSALLNLDTDHAASVGEVLGCRGALYTVGGACASANVALRAALDEIRHHGHDVALVAGAALEFSPMGLQAMVMIDAITFQSFNDEPERASRPYDLRREGFVPSHGVGCLVLEREDRARARGARIYAEVLGCVATSDGSHLPTPSREGQAETLKRLFRAAGVAPEEVQFVCAHATSTPQGDLSEIGAIRDAFGAHAERLRINAPKSMLGHTCWAAPATETVAAVLQATRGRLHPSVNIDELDPAVELDVCAGEAVTADVDVFIKNSFGFGGINCCSAFRRYAS
jgi:3-oxoacyl-(acyl-carrier-protein) synthase